MFPKPEEFIIHRPHHYTGLGLHSIKYKSIAGFITTFLQTAVNPTYQRNLLHYLLLRKHLLLTLPYFTQELFNIIREVKDESTINISKLSEKDWTRFLTENYVTMTSKDIEADDKIFTPSKAERASPAIDNPASLLTSSAFSGAS